MLYIVSSLSEVKTTKHPNYLNTTLGLLNVKIIGILNMWPVKNNFSWQSSVQNFWF